ncbi:MAG: hypothetical protein HYY18_06500 [Planctomycetes bacterium]|nr:hypothetical protein [Planctomycetota bacterium]
MLRKRSPARLKFAIAALAGLALWAGAAGCGSAPLQPGDAGAGRALFEARCAACHELPEPCEYSPVEWRGLIRQMGPQAGLDRRLQGDVLAYVLEEAAIE